MTLARLEAVDHWFGDHHALDDLHLEVGAGEVVGLLGANGAGKTTAIRVLLGLLAPTAGRVELVGGAPSRHTRQRLGYIPQGLGLWTDLSVADHLDLSRSLFGRVRALEDPELVDLTDRQVGDLAVGLQRRLAFHLALAHGPDLLVLDEPTSGVDPLARARLWDAVHAAADGGAGVLVSTHYLDEAAQCDRILLLVDGRVVASGTVGQVVGATTAVQVTALDWQRAWQVLADAGHAALPAGRRLRVTGTSVDAVRATLHRSDTVAEVSEVPATLEEVFLLATTGER